MDNVAVVTIFFFVVLKLYTYVVLLFLSQLFCFINFLNFAYWIDRNQEKR